MYTMLIIISMKSATSNNIITSLRTNAHYLEVINTFASELQKTRTINDIVWTVAKHAVAKLGFIDCVVYLFGLEDMDEISPTRPIHLICKKATRSIFFLMDL